ncbi:MAG: GTPase activating protein, partial [Watsoniomyces obsoletus]
FHIFIAMAIMEKHRDVLMEHLKHFDEVLKYFNELSGTIDIMDTLVRAEKLFRRFQSMVGVVEKGGLPKRQEVLRQRKAQIMSGPGGPPNRPVATGREDSASTDEAAQKSVISPELRGLLSREVSMSLPKAPAAQTTSTS